MITTQRDIDQDEKAMGLRNDISNAMVMISDDDYNDYNDYDYDDDDENDDANDDDDHNDGMCIGKDGRRIGEATSVHGANLPAG